jgi:hypothetical protein
MINLGDYWYENTRRKCMIQETSHNFSDEGFSIGLTCSCGASYSINHSEWDNRKIAGKVAAIGDEMHNAIFNCDSTETQIDNLTIIADETNGKNNYQKFIESRKEEATARRKEKEENKKKEEIENKRIEDIGSTIASLEF